MTTHIMRLLASAALFVATPALAQSTLTIKDGLGVQQTVRAPNADGRAAAATSAPVVLSNEDSATLGTLFKAGQSIGNTAFSIAGTLPAFTTTPTFNIGTAPTLAVTGTFWQATQPVSGSVTVSNLPTTQTVAGSVSVSNFPAASAGGGTATTSAPTYTNGQTGAALSLDLAGNLRVTGGTGGALRRPRRAVRTPRSSRFRVRAVRPSRCRAPSGSPAPRQSR